jgi:hypothetical protein
VKYTGQWRWESESSISLEPEMRFKKPKSIRSIRKGPDARELVSPDDILMCYRVRKDLPQERLLAAMFPILKFGILANARVLARTEGSHYLILLSLLDHPSAESVRQNLKRQPIEEIEECGIPELRGAGFIPWGQTLPGRICDMCVEMLSKDADLAEALDSDTAKRMDEHPGEEFIFPDLSPERYEQVKERKGKKPS